MYEGKLQPTDNTVTLALFRDHHFLSFCLEFALARARIPSASLLLDPVCLFHRPFQLPSLIHWFRYMPTSVPSTMLVETVRVESTAASIKQRCTYRCTLLISASIFRHSLSALWYSIVERSRAVTMFSFSDTFAFHTRTMPSSDPENTKRASAVSAVDSTRCIRFVWYTSGCVPWPSCHIRRVRSHPPETNSVPVGDQSRDVTAETCAL